MVLEEDFESFLSNLPIEEEVIVVENEEDSGCARLEVLQVSSFNS